MADVDEISRKYSIIHMHDRHDCEYKCFATSIKGLYHINDPDLFK